MIAPILIIRTVSIEKLSSVIDACHTRWPGHPIVVVSNPGRIGELRLDPRIEDIIPYFMGLKGFDKPILISTKFEAVVVPIANRRGSGYANVLRACRKLKASTWFLASYSRQLKSISRFKLSLFWRTELALGYFTHWLGRIWFAVIQRS